MVAVAKKGGELTVYSDRFSYSGFKGKSILPAPVTKAISNLKGTDGPDTKDATGDKAAGAGTQAPDAKLFDMAYTLQTGPTRYAPMQPVPPTKITATNTKPLYPTSSVKIAKSKLPIPSAVITITASQTFSVKSHENTVCCRYCWWRLHRANRHRSLPLPMLPTTWPSSSDAGRIRWILEPRDLDSIMRYQIYDKNSMRNGRLLFDIA
jgi:hypothetical protein